MHFSPSFDSDSQYQASTITAPCMDTLLNILWLWKANILLLWAAPPQGYPCHLMCRRVNIEGLRLLLLEGIVYKFGPWLAPGTLDFKRVPTFPILIRMVHCAQTFCINNVVYPEQLAFLVGIWNFCTYRHGVPLWPTFDKNLGFWILWASW